MVTSEKRSPLSEEEQAKFKRNDKNSCLWRLDLLLLKDEEKPYVTLKGYGYELVTPNNFIEVIGPFETVWEAVNDAMAKINNQKHRTFYNHKGYFIDSGPSVNREQWEKDQEELADYYKGVGLIYQYFQGQVVNFSDIPALQKAIAAYKLGITARFDEESDISVNRWLYQIKKMDPNASR